MKHYIHNFIIGIILSSALASCGSTLRLDSTPATCTAISNGSVEHPASIGMRNGEIFSGYSIVTGKDSTQWFSDSDSKLITAQTSQIAFIRIAKPKILSGFIGGGLLGGALGSVIGFLSVSSTPNQLPSYPSAFPIVGSLVGGVAGAFVGKGHTILYESPNHEQ